MGCDFSVVAGSMCSGNGFVTHVSRCHLAPCSVRHFLSWVLPKMSNHSTSTKSFGLAFCVKVCDAGMTWGGAALLQLSRGENRGRRGLNPGLWLSACTLSPKATLPGGRRSSGCLSLYKAPLRQSCVCTSHPPQVSPSVCLSASCEPEGGILDGLHK